MSDRGWICPRCETVHAPSVLKCECVAKKLDPADVRKLVDDAVQRMVTIPVIVPYYVPTYPSPCCPEPYRWTITSGDVYVGDSRTCSASTSIDARVVQ